MFPVGLCLDTRPVTVAGKCACEFPPTERGRKCLSRDLAFGILLYSVTSDSAMTFRSKTIF